MSTDESARTPIFEERAKTGLSLLFQLAEDLEPFREDIIKLATEDKDSVLDPRATVLAHVCFKITRTLFLVNDAYHEKISTFKRTAPQNPEVAPSG